MINEMNMNNNDFKIGNYTDIELFNLMDLNNPSDRELEARVIMLLNQYESDSDVYRFFEDVFDHFFSQNDDTILEGFTAINVPPQQNAIIAPPPLNIMQQNNDSTENNDGPVKQNKNYITPSLSDPIKRIICIDSQYRDSKIYPFSTNFTFNLSETLSDVISIKLYSLQVPFTWYTVGNEFGSNFFYLKGISPGINNGNFDYKIQIDPGNYQQNELATSINASIQNLILKYTDVSFGMTGVTYNRINSRLTTVIDIESVYNETNYYIDFSHGIENNDHDPAKVSSLRQLFGFNDYEYFPCSVFSNYITDNIINRYQITNDNNTIYIVLYQSSIVSGRVLEYNSLDISYNYSIISSLVVNNYYTSLEIINDFNNQIKNSPFLAANSSLTLVKNRYVLKLVFNRANSQVYNNQNYKSYVNFQGDLWVGVKSLFNFSYSKNELNNVISEKKSSETTTSYTISSTLSLSFVCNNPNYINGPIFSIDTSMDVYDAISYIKQINKYLLGKNNDPNSIFNARLSISNDNFITIDCEAKKEIYVANVIFDTNNISYDKNNDKQVFQIRGLNNDGYNVDILATNIGYYIRDNTFFDIILNNDNFTRPIYLHIPIPTAKFASSVDYIYYIIENIKRYKSNDYLEINLSQSTFLSFEFDRLNENIKCNLNIVAVIELIESDYSIVLKEDTWKTNFGLDSSYKLKIALTTLKGKQIQSKMLFYTNLIYLTLENNYFLIRPVYNAIGGVYTKDEIYAKKIILKLDVNTTYTKEQVALAINNQFNNDIETSGSYVDISLNTIIRLNINKIFTSLDYKLVFFDADFVQCSYGNRNHIRNVKWDTTLGWVLGYRNLTEYNLTLGNLSTDGNLTYYNVYFNQQYIINNKTVLLTGDTSININLYNYLLLVIDDFCQNRINDGLVTISKTENNIPLPSYANRSIYRCDPTNNQTNLAIDRVDNNNLTAKQVYSATQILNIKQINSSINKLYSAGPDTQDIFGMIPMKTGGLNPGDSFIDFSGGLQNQERKYVGPVNLRRMSIQLLNDKGSVLDLNGANWSFSLIIEQIYNPAK
jgi:hypothetical protein